MLRVRHGECGGMGFVQASYAFFLPSGVTQGIIFPSNENSAIFLPRASL
jgi:hypothetical protein